MHNRFSKTKEMNGKVNKGDEWESKLSDTIVPKCNHSRYLGLIFQENRMIEEDVTHGTNEGWLKWSTIIVMYDKKKPLTVKGKNAQNHG